MSGETALVPAKQQRLDKPRAVAQRIEQMPTPIEKAAVILTAIGPELAAGFLKEIAEPDMERFARALAGLGRPTVVLLEGGYDLDALAASVGAHVGALMAA